MSGEVFPAESELPLFGDGAGGDHGSALAGEVAEESSAGG